MYGTGVCILLSLLPFSLISFTLLIFRSSVLSAVSVVTFYYYFPFNIALVLLFNTYSTLIHTHWLAVLGALYTLVVLCSVCVAWLHRPAVDLAGWVLATSACRMVFLAPAQVPLNYGSSHLQLLHKFCSRSGFSSTTLLLNYPASCSPRLLDRLAAGYLWCTVTDVLFAQILSTCASSTSPDNWSYCTMLCTMRMRCGFALLSNTLLRCVLCWTLRTLHSLSVSILGGGGTSPLASSKAWHGNVMDLAEGGCNQITGLFP